MVTTFINLFNIINDLNNSLIIREDNFEILNQVFQNCYNKTITGGTDAAYNRVVFLTII